MEHIRELVSIIILSDNGKLLIITLLQTLSECFQTIVNFCWTPCLEFAFRVHKSPERAGAYSYLPLGAIFGCFAVAKLLGTMVYNFTSFRVDRDKLQLYKVEIK